MTLKEAAVKVLSEHDGPMRTRDIWNAIRERGYYKGKGKTPYRTLTARLTTDVCRNDTTSMFVRHGFGLYGLRNNSGDGNKQFLTRQHRFPITHM